MTAAAKARAWLDTCREAGNRDDWLAHLAGALDAPAETETIVRALADHRTIDGLGPRAPVVYDDRNDPWCIHCEVDSPWRGPRVDLDDPANHEPLVSVASGPRVGRSKPEGDEQVSATFNEHVAVWLRNQGTPAVKVLSVRGEGTEWYGSTESGWDDKFDVSITCELDTGEIASCNVDGEELAELWNWVVAAWPHAEAQS